MLCVDRATNESNTPQKTTLYIGIVVSDSSAASGDTFLKVKEPTSDENSNTSATLWEFYLQKPDVLQGKVCM